MLDMTLIEGVCAYGTLEAWSVKIASLRCFDSIHISFQSIITIISKLVHRNAINLHDSSNSSRFECNLRSIEIHTGQRQALGPRPCIPTLNVAECLTQSNGCIARLI